MAGLTTDGIKRLEVSDLNSNNSETLNDGATVLDHIEAFLTARNATTDKIDLITSLLGNVFKNKAMWQPSNGESLIKSLFAQISQDIIPLLESNLHLDFTGKILNALSDWVSIDNDKANDVVLTPSYVTHFMARLARTNKDSFVWDLAMGSGGFLVSAMDIMIKDAENKIQDKDELEAKVTNIKENQLLGVEILGNIYILAVLNMILMGDGSTHMYRDDSHSLYTQLGKKFPATVFLLNPPYSAEGKGFIFVQEALSQMTKGYAAILIQENAGSGKGLPYTKNILKDNTITVCYNGSVGEAFYQDEPYWASDDINVLTLRDFKLNAEVAEYLCTVLKKAGSKYGYTYKWNVSRMKKSTISLPVTANKVVDFKYMENYIKAVQKLTIKNVVKYKDEVINKTKEIIN